MAGSLRRALCAAASFVLLPAAAHAAAPKEISNDLGADNFALPDAPTLADGTSNCDSGAVLKPVLLRGLDLADTDTFVETSLTLDPSRPAADAVDARPLIVLTTIGDAVTSDDPGIARAEEESCANGITRTSAPQAAPRSAPQRT
jgi:hypothetical protein